MTKAHIFIMMKKKLGTDLTEINHNHISGMLIILFYHTRTMHTRFTASESHPQSPNLHVSGLASLFPSSILPSPSKEWYLNSNINHLTARLRKLIVTKLSLKIRVHDFVYITCILTAITPEPII